MALTQEDLIRIRREQASKRPVVDEITVAEDLGVAARIASEVFPPTALGRVPAVFVVSDNPSATPGLEHDLELAKGLFPNRDPIEVVAS